MSLATRVADCECHRCHPASVTGLSFCFRTWKPKNRDESEQSSKHTADRKKEKHQHRDGRQWAAALNNVHFSVKKAKKEEGGVLAQLSSFFQWKAQHHQKNHVLSSFAALFHVSIEQEKKLLLFQQMTARLLTRCNSTYIRQQEEFLVKCCIFFYIIILSNTICIKCVALTCQRSVNVFRKCSKTNSAGVCVRARVCARSPHQHSHFCTTGFNLGGVLLFLSLATSWSPTTCLLCIYHYYCY